MHSNLPAYINDFLPEIDRELKLRVSLLDGSGFEDLHKMLAYQMGWEGQNAGPGAGGKRIRPLLVLLATGAAGGDWQQALPAAAAVELVHNFSLIHDDIEDNSPLRRGRPTLWKKWGIPQAINSGDTMFTLAKLAVLGLENATNREIALEASIVLLQTCLELTQGQFLDLSYESRTDLTVDDYWPMVEGKTASLIGTCTELGAVIAGHGGEKRHLYRKFGLSLGLAFQAQDDLLGIWGDLELTGKSVESDLVAGKKSLPVLFGLSLKGEFARLWGKGPIPADQVGKMASILENEGARAYTEGKADYYTQDSITSLDKARPRSDYGDALLDLADQLLNRSH